MKKIKRYKPKQNKMSKKHNKKHNGSSCSDEDSFPKREKITFSSRQNISICTARTTVLVIIFTKVQISTVIFCMFAEFIRKRSYPSDQFKWLTKIVYRHTLHLREDREFSTASGQCIYSSSSFHNMISLNTPVLKV